MPFLPATLASIANQTYSSWTVLARDDGSTDATLETLRSWIPSRIPGRVIVGDSIGLGRSLRQLVETAQTEFCARIDADDINTADRLEVQVEYLREHADVSAVGGQMTTITEAGIPSGPFPTLPLCQLEICWRLLYASALAHPTVLFRRSAVIGVGNYRNTLLEDYDLWLRLAPRHKLANLDREILRYRIHGNSFTTQVTSGNRIGPAAIDCVCENGRALFGITPTELRLLREGKHPCALYALFRMSRHLNRITGERLSSAQRAGIFSDVLRKYRSRTDVISRLFLKINGAPRNAISIN